MRTKCLFSMTTPAAIQGTFADLKTVKTRSVVQMIIEVPIEQGKQVVDAFGFPQPGSEIPVAVARLNPTAAKQEKPARKPAATRAEKARRMCGVEQFQGFVFQRAPNAVRDGRGGAYQTASDGVKEICGVVTKADLDVLPVPMKRWDALFAEYEQSVGRMAQVTR